MSEPNLSSILPLLQQFGISPDKLGPERLEKLLSMSSVIQDPDKMTPEVANSIMDTLGINTNMNNQSAGTNIPKKNKRIGRNDKCPNCESGLKYKKCCGK